MLNCCFAVIDLWLVTTNIRVQQKGLQENGSPTLYSLTCHLCTLLLQNMTYYNHHHRLVPLSTFLDYCPCSFINTFYIQTSTDSLVLLFQKKKNSLVLSKKKYDSSIFYHPDKINSFKYRINFGLCFFNSNPSKLFVPKFKIKNKMCFLFRKNIYLLEKIASLPGENSNLLFTLYNPYCYKRQK